MGIFARLKAAKWKLLGGVMMSILLGGVGARFWSLSTRPLSPQEPLPSLSVNNVVEPKQSALSPETQSGIATIEAHKHPQTGRFEKPPVDSHQRKTLIPSGVPGRGDEPRPLAPPLNEWMSPVAGGGIVTNIRLRFRRPLVATKDADGVLTIQHAPEEADVDVAQ